MLQSKFSSWYFRKLAKYVHPSEYNHIKNIRDIGYTPIAIPELLFLRSAIRKLKPKTIVEIGSFTGGSTSAMADILKELDEGKIYAIDFFSKTDKSSKLKRNEYWKEFDHRMASYLNYYEKIEDHSQSIIWNRPIDLLFIDGDHSEAAAKADFFKYGPFVRPGGHVFFHDYYHVVENDSQVNVVVDEHLKNSSSFELLGLVNSLIGFIKK